MVSSTRSLGMGVALALTCIASAAHSRSIGLTGRSGKQTTTCSSCHQGGVAPNVVLDGPTSLDAGSLAVYTFRVDSDAAAITGINVAASDGVLEDDDGTTTRKLDSELVHKTPLAPDGGAAIYTFSLTAPAFGGKVTLFAAGNACDGNGTTSGDESAATTLEVDISGPPRPSPEDAAVVAPPVRTGSSSPPKNATPLQDDSGCSIGWSDDGPFPAGAILAALLGLLAVLRGRISRRT